MRPVTITAAEAEPLARASQLLQQEVGGFPLSSLRELAADPRVCILADWQAPGVVVARRLTGLTQGLCAFSLPPAFSRLVAQGRVGTIEGLAVPREARGRGRGAALAAAGVRWLLDGGARYVAVIAWQPRDGSPGSTAILRRARCVPLGRARMAAIQDERYCPLCGRPCACEAILFGSPLNCATWLLWRSAAALASLRRRRPSP